jgi:hypothetical protein
MRDDWERLLYLVGVLLLIAPAVLSLRYRPGNKLLYAAVWLGVAGALALTYRLLAPAGW